ncbi:hypothetical protein [Kibdelosporangium aridum]|uniref:hypothetical protein n=1 Tax=Kibdelosporangium aridum TaxID=2030 RepID=UPI000A006DB9|nr:hypothetical protein [Kibdelosporangium aridum]
MLRILIAMLVLTGCATTPTPTPTQPTPQQPTGTLPSTPVEVPTESPPPPPADWFEVLVNSFGRRTPPSGEGEWRTFSHRHQTTTMYVTFHNIGEEPITAPKIEFSLEQRQPTSEPGRGLETHFTGASGDDWRCTGAEASITCTSEATVEPRASMPTIDIGVKAVAPVNTRTHFIAAFGDLRYEAIVHYDTST